MATATDNILRIGLYTPAEAAFYARIRTQLMTSWLYGGKNRQPVVEPQRGPEVRDVSFLDFVQALAIRAIRRDYRISLQKIRGAVEFAKAHYGESHPLATRHKTFLFDRNSAKNEKPDDEDSRYELVINLEENGKTESLVQLTGHKAGNRLIGEIVELFLKDVSFDGSGRAAEYRAFAYGDLAVTMNPHRHFGEPLLPSGYPAQTLWEAVPIEGSIEAAAKAYGIDATEVELACRYLDFLEGPSTA
jgi:hypothetical protein